jgi:hypothetical protein
VLTFQRGVVQARKRASRTRAREVLILCLPRAIGGATIEVGFSREYTNRCPERGQRSPDYEMFKWRTLLIVS